jgi:hypothetical protein
MKVTLVANAHVGEAASVVLRNRKSQPLLKIRSTLQLKTLTRKSTKTLSNSKSKNSTTHLSTKKRLPIEDVLVVEDAAAAEEPVMNKSVRRLDQNVAEVVAEDARSRLKK